MSALREKLSQVTGIVLVAGIATRARLESARAEPTLNVQQQWTVGGAGG